MDFLMSTAGASKAAKQLNSQLTNAARGPRLADLLGSRTLAYFGKT